MRYVTRGLCPSALNAVDHAGQTELDRARQFFVNDGNQSGFDFDIYKRTSVRSALRRTGA